MYKVKSINKKVLKESYKEPHNKRLASFSVCRCSLKLTFNSSGFSPPLYFSPCRFFDSGSGPAVPDHPWPRSDLHPPSAAGRVDHRAPLHHPGHHLPHGHLRSGCDVTLAQRGKQICPVDRLHGEYVSTASVFFCFMHKCSFGMCSHARGYRQQGLNKCFLQMTAAVC